MQKELSIEEFVFSEKHIGTNHTVELCISLNINWRNKDYSISPLSGNHFNFDKQKIGSYAVTLGKMINEAAIFAEMRLTSDAPKGG